MKIDIDKKLSFIVYDDTRRLSNISFNFGDKQLTLFDTKDFLYFYTILQMFLQGRLEEKKKRFELTMSGGIRNDEDEIIKLDFCRFADFRFRKVSENDKQRLVIEITNYTAIAKKEDQDWKNDKNKKNLEKFKDYIDKEIDLVSPEKRLDISRFNAQYYFNILQKMSFSW